MIWFGYVVCLFISKLKKWKKHLKLVKFLKQIQMNNFIFHFQNNSEFNRFKISKTFLFFKVLVKYCVQSKDQEKSSNLFARSSDTLQSWLFTRRQRSERIDEQAVPKCSCDFCKTRDEYWKSDRVHEQRVFWKTAVWQFHFHYSHYVRYLSAVR